MNPSDFVYFILTEKPKTILKFKPGSICYLSGHKYEREVSKSPPVTKLRVKFLNSHPILEYEIDKAYMKKLNVDEADLLLACEPESDRLNWIKDLYAVQTALGLTIGTNVMVEDDGKTMGGIIRFIGPMAEPTFTQPIRGRFFGIDLQV